MSKKTSLEELESVVGVLARDQVLEIESSALNEHEIGKLTHLASERKTGKCAC